MARGWESKAIEAQQDAAAARRPGAADPAAKGATSPADIARAQERATLLLARTRALADLQHACAANHRAMLEQAIADLDRRIKNLTPS